MAAASGGLDQVAIDEFAALVDAGRWRETELKAQAMLTNRPEAGMLWKILGVANARQGKDALPALRRAVELMPDDAEAHVNMAMTLRALGRGPDALTSLRRALQIEPEHGDALIQAADLASSQGQTQEAIALYRRALRHDPRSAQTQNNLGNAFFELAQYAAAADAYRAALTSNPDDAKIHCNLCNALRLLGQLPSAVASGRRALALNPGLAEAHNNLGLALAAQGEFELAQASYRSALALDSGYVDALNNLGNVLRDLGDQRQSLTFYSQAVQCDPLRAESLCNLGNMMFETQRIDEAAGYYTRALSLKSDHTAAHVALAMVLRMQGKGSAATESCRAALAVDPDCVEALALLGELQADHGRFAEAQALFQQAIAVDPSFPFTFFNVSMHRKMTSDDGAWLKATNTLLARRLPLRHEICLRYALGKYNDDLRLYESAFEQYSLANDLAKRTGPNYDPAMATAGVDDIIGRFDAAFIARAQGIGNRSQRPVFIVGMPRSGTSLTEQILASHPEVFGAGELPFWGRASGAFQTVEYAGRPVLDQIAGMARDYLAGLSQLSENASRVVDKMPANFLNLGLIHAAFPNARIIHMRRHPIDTCLSIHFQYFFSVHPYANDLSALAHYYTQYLRIMEHWRRILPAETLLEVPYESLVCEQEFWSRRMLEFVGLPWDSQCLNFHETDRSVFTASKWQVRQKIHANSTGRWQNYAKFVGPLRTLIEPSAGRQHLPPPRAGSD